MRIEDLLDQLQQRGYTLCTEEANRQNKLHTRYVFLGPGGDGVFYCDTDEEVQDLFELAVG